MSNITSCLPAYCTDLRCDRDFCLRLCPEEIVQNEVLFNVAMTLIATGAFLALAVGTSCILRYVKCNKRRNYTQLKGNDLEGQPIGSHALSINAPNSQLNRGCCKDRICCEVQGIALTIVVLIAGLIIGVFADKQITQRCCDNACHHLNGS